MGAWENWIPVVNVGAQHARGGGGKSTPGGGGGGHPVSL